MANCSCNHCLEIVENPITVWPCGHTFCSSCKDAYIPFCIGCKDDEAPSEIKYSNKLLQEIVSNLNYIQQTIEALKIPIYKKI